MDADSPRPVESKLMMHMQNGITCIQFTDSKIIDVRMINQIGTELTELIEKRAVRKMLIDMQNVQFLSSAMLGKLMSAHKTLKANKGTLKLCGIAPTLFEVFKITRLDKVFEIYPTVADALIAFRPGSQM